MICACKKPRWSKKSRAAGGGPCWKMDCAKAALCDSESALRRWNCWNWPAVCATTDRVVNGPFRVSCGWPLSFASNRESIPPTPLRCRKRWNKSRKPTRHSLSICCSTTISTETFNQQPAHLKHRCTWCLKMELVKIQSTQLIMSRSVTLKSR